MPAQHLQPRLAAIHLSQLNTGWLGATSNNILSEHSRRAPGFAAGIVDHWQAVTSAHPEDACWRVRPAYLDLSPPPPILRRTFPRTGPPDPSWECRHEGPAPEAAAVRAASAVEIKKERPDHVPTELETPATSAGGKLWTMHAVGGSHLSPTLVASRIFDRRTPHILHFAPLPQTYPRKYSYILPLPANPPSANVDTSRRMPLDIYDD